MAEESQYIIPRIVKGEDGQFRTVYVDALSGEVVNNVDGKTLLSAGNTSVANPVGTTPTTTPTSTDSKSGDFADQITEQLYPEVRRGSERSVSGGNGKKNINPVDNYGYMDKPGAISALGMLPGAIGLVGKGLNAAINVGNVGSVNQARSALGLGPLSQRQTLGAAIKGTSGQVADVNIGDNKYSVGFGALSPTGKTNLTPMEAVTRANLANTAITENAGAKFTSKSLGQKAAEKVDKATGGVLSKALSSIGLEKGFATRALDNLGIKSKEENKTQSVLGLEKGWATKGLNNLFGVKEKEKTASNSTITAAEPTPREVSSTSYGVTPTTANPGVGFTSQFGPNRPNMPSQNIVGAIQSSVMNTFGPGYSVVGISGQEEDENGNGRIDPNEQYGSPRHKTGLALDFDVMDPSGRKVTDVNAMNDLAANFAYNNPTAGIGFGTGYMAPGRAHFDITGMGNEWGAGGLGANMAPGLRETIEAARAGYQPTPFSNAPSPTARPSSVDTGFVSQDERPSRLDPIGNSLNPMAATSFMSTAPQTNVARQTVANQISLSKNTTPAQFAAMGLTARTPEQIDSISRTIAGELSPRSLQALTAGDEDATREVANMVATIENRAASNINTGLAATLNPSSYNSLMSKNKAVTDQNYGMFKDPINAAVSSFYSNQNQPSNWGVTNYYNPSISNPGWGMQMTNQAVAGAHLFGTLPEYSPNSAFSRTLGAYTPTENYAGGGTSIGYGAYDTPSERNAASRLDSTRSNGYQSSSPKASALGLPGAGTPGTGLGLRNTPSAGYNGSNTTGRGVASSGSGLNSAGNRATGAGPMSGKNTNTSSSSSKSSSSASHEANASRSSTSAGGGKSAGKSGGHNAD